MIKKNLIKTVGLEVHSLAFGGAGIGNLFRIVSNEQAINAVEKAAEIGWRFFDVAPHYGSGLAERRMGLGLRVLDREDYVLSTKVGRLLATRGKTPGLEAGDFFYEEAPFNRVHDYTHDGIMRSYEDSIQRLGTRYIDILYVHDLGSYAHGKTDVERKHFKDFCESGVKALEELKKKGLIKAWGLGVNEEEIIMEILDHTSPDVCMFASRYNLLEPDHDAFFEKCRKHNLSLVSAAPFASGVLVSSDRKKSTYEYGKVSDELIKKIEGIDAICKKHNVPIGAAAVQFPLRNPVVVSVCCGVKSAEQAKKNYDWANFDIPEALWSDLAKMGIK